MIKNLLSVASEPLCIAGRLVKLSADYDIDDYYIDNDECCILPPQRQLSPEEQQCSQEQKPSQPPLSEEEEKRLQEEQRVEEEKRLQEEKRSEFVIRSILIVLIIIMIGTITYVPHFVTSSDVTSSDVTSSDAASSDSKELVTAESVDPPSGNYTVTFENTSVSQGQMVKFTILKNGEPVTNNVYCVRSFDPNKYGEWYDVAGLYQTDWTSSDSGTVKIFVGDELVATKNITVIPDGSYTVNFESTSVAQDSMVKFTILENGKPVTIPTPDENPFLKAINEAKKRSEK